nr:putative ribonuclease H-like domain-containing protein [Tanacetum cinerariifolium]
MSSAEAEYVSLSACCAQVLWMRTQLTDYGFHFDKIPMYCDSKAAIAISCNPVQHSRTKHIDVRYHFIKEKVENDADLSGTPINQTKYHSMVGALMYLTASRRDIMHATCYCACYQAKLIEKHLTAVKWIFWYLKDTIHIGLWYPKDTGFELTAFSESDHAGCLDLRKSTSGGIQFLGGDKLVSWSLKKQDYYGFHFDKIPMYYDSKAAIAISCNPVQHLCTKHINVRYHFIKEKVEKGIVELFFVETEYQLADMFTKALPEERFKYLIRRLGVTPLVDHHCCYKCGDSLNDFFCGNGAHKLQNEYAQPFSPIAITFDLPTTETEDSLKIGDEHLDTIPETESDEFIKSSVENLVPSPSKSEDLSDSECDVPACDDFTTFFNFLFDADDDFSSSDNESFFDEDISKEIYSNPLFDEEIISMKIDPHHFNVESDLIESLLNHDSLIISSSSSSKIGEFVGELILLKTIPLGFDETDCDPEEEIRLIEKLLYDNSSPRPPKEFISGNSDAEIESFSPFPIPVEDNDSLMKEIDLSFTPDDSMPPGIENDEYDSNGDMLILEELLSNNSLSLLENESFHFDIPSSLRPPTKPPNENSGILNVKVMGDTSEHDVPMLKLFPTQPTLVSNQEKSPHLLSH